MTDFSESFQKDLKDLMLWRRDVRHFRQEPVDEALLMQCLDAFLTAPSVGLSEPWRVIRIQNPGPRAAALANFERCNAQALAGYDGEKAQTYSRLKLSGMRDAPEHLAVFCDDGTSKGSGLGAATMPETRRYSVVSAITLFWLAARARGLGVGWVSILDPGQLRRDLGASEQWSLVGYLCVGWPKEVSLTPELETADWERRRAALPLRTA